MGETSSIQLDDLDRKILMALEADSSLSIAKLAEKIDEPSTTVYNRINKLKNRHVITGYTIKTNRDLLYGSIVAYILIQVTRGDQTQILHQLSDNSHVEDAAIITGQNDLLCKIRVRTITELNEFILDYLREIPGISNSQSMIALEHLQQD